MAPVDPPSHPLDRLNETERELLILLGRGHTAKSIASLKALSVAAVNERFRSARRKTGLASSREIARLLVAQENRDDLIDLASGEVPPTTPPRQDAPPPRRASITRRWRPMMITATLFSAALLAYGTATPTFAPGEQTPAPASGPISQVLAGLAPSPDIAALHAEASRPSTDPSWSLETEQRLSERYHQLPAFDEGVEVLNVTCAASLCEIAGRFRPGLSQDSMNALVEAIQALGRSEPRLDLIVNYFNTSSSEPSSAVFATYWRRRD